MTYDDRSAKFGSTLIDPEFRYAAGNVTVFGAGIAGLTAAHELAERGFRVLVVEPEAPGSGTLQVGGMARTQRSVGEPDNFWSRAVVPWTTSTDSPAGGAAEAVSRCARAVLFRWNSPEFEKPNEAIGVAVDMAAELVRELSARAAKLARVPGLKALLRLEPPRAHEQLPAEWQLTSFLRVIGRRSAGETVRLGAAVPTPVASPPRPEDEELCKKRADNTCDVLRKLVDERLQLELLRLEAEPQRDVARIALLRLVAQVDATRLVQPDVLRGSDPSDCCAIIELAWKDEVVLPGEHGYRFFPSFYRHLFDTMQRTPLYEDGAETHRTVFDNLRPTLSQVFAGALTSAGLTRRRPRSLEALRTELVKLLGELHFELGDVAKFQAKIFRFMTTCSARRRAEYENLSWWDFLTRGGVSYSERFEHFLKCAPQALVAMDAETCDARTQGNIVVQLLIDQLLDSQYTDCTLNGPTSDAWLELWREHLGYLGVTFITGELVEFEPRSSSTELFGGLETAEPKVSLRLPETAAARGNPRAYWQEQIEKSDYFVVATDVVAAEKVTEKLATLSRRQVLPGVPRRVGGVPVELREYVSYVLSKTDMRIKAGLDSDWDRLQRERLAVAGFPSDYWGHIRGREELPAWSTYAESQDLRTGRRRWKAVDQYVFGLTRHDRFQTFSGVQYFFAHDLEQARGHVYYFDTEWGLSSISPLQFWQQRVALRRKGVLGLLSVDIGNFRARSSFLGKAAHECTKEEIAHEVWRQISESLRRTRRAKAQESQRLPLPRPIYYHVDDFLRPGQPPSIFDAPQPTLSGTLCTTATPFLVNNVGDWSNRPGSDPWDPTVEGLPVTLVDEPNVWQADHGGYQVHYHKIVFAGTYMRTFTRMTTMEAANESARHAVNAILDHLASVRTVAQREAANRYGEWVSIALSEYLDKNRDRINPKDLGDQISKVRDQQVQLPFPMQTIAGEHCKIWNLERLELEDLAFLKRVDQMLFDKQLAHMADILDLDGLAARANPELSSFEGILSALQTTFKKDWNIDDDAVFRGAKGAAALLEKLKDGVARLAQELGRGNAPP